MPVLMVLPAWPSLAVPESRALAFRPELLHAGHTIPATRAAASAVGILKNASICRLRSCLFMTKDDGTAFRVLRMDLARTFA
jgi:hypothetical protein